MSTDTILTEELNGLTLRVVPDYDPLNPREHFSNLGSMVCFHKRYSLGDKTHGYLANNYSSWSELERAIEQDHGADTVILPIYMYDHGGITLRCGSFTCPWDSGQVGFIFCSKETIRKEYGKKRVTARMLEQTREVLIGEVKLYSAYVEGACCGYIIEKDGEHVDSCWGYYSVEDALNCARAITKELQCG